MYCSDACKQQAYRERHKRNAKPKSLLSLAPSEGPSPTPNAPTSNDENTSNPSKEMFTSAKEALDYRIQRASADYARLTKKELETLRDLLNKVKPKLMMDSITISGIVKQISYALTERK
jgi:hypothetical protein